MRFQNCVFDLYGTLVDIHTDEDSQAVWEAGKVYFAANGADYELDELRSAYLRLVGQAEAAAAASSRQDAHEAHPEIQIEGIFRTLFQEKGVDAAPPMAVRAALTFRRSSTRYIRLYDGAAELLRALRESGRKTWLLSNAQSCFTKMELKELGLLPLFDGICLSSDYGCKKPDRRFFDLFLRKYHIDPGDAVMVGNDGVCDIQGAKAAGLATLYIQSNLSPDGPEPAADYVLKEMNLAKVRKILCSA